jgi:hypothetical protein
VGIRVEVTQSEDEMLRIENACGYGGHYDVQTLTPSSKTQAETGMDFRMLALMPLTDVACREISLAHLRKTFGGAECFGANMAYASAMQDIALDGGFGFVGVRCGLWLVLLYRLSRNRSRKMQRKLQRKCRRMLVVPPKWACSSAGRAPALQARFGGCLSAS